MTNQSPLVMTDQLGITRAPTNLPVWVLIKKHNSSTTVNVCGVFFTEQEAHRAKTVLQGKSKNWELKVQKSITEPLSQIPHIDSYYSVSRDNTGVTVSTGHFFPDPEKVADREEVVQSSGSSYSTWASNELEAMTKVEAFKRKQGEED